MIGSVTAVLVMTLLVLRVLDDPYEPGVGSLRPVAMERALGVLEEASVALDLTVPPPCDATGTPDE